MNGIKTNIKNISILTLIFISFSAQTEEEIKTSSIDVIDKAINEQSYISGGGLSNELIRFNSIKSNNSGSLLDYFTGINSATNGGGSSMPVIRGLADDRIKIKVDGMDLIAACANHMNSPLSSIDSSNVEEIKVFAGLTPVSMGGDSIGGSILINSAQPEYAKNGERLVRNKLSTFYRSNNKSKSLNINSIIASEDLSINYNGSYIYAENFKAGKPFKKSGNAASDRELLEGMK